MPSIIPCNTCGKQIWFDWDHRFGDLGYSDPSRAKPNIPLEVGGEGQLLEQKHNCPNSEWNKGRRGGAGSGGGNVSRDIEPSAMKMVLANGLDALAKVEHGNQSLQAISKTLFRMDDKINKIMEHLNIVDPNNDDGDSQREVSESDFNYDDPKNDSRS